MLMTLAKKYFRGYYSFSIFVLFLAFCLRVFNTKAATNAKYLSNAYLETKRCYSLVFFNYDNYVETFNMIDKASQKCSFIFTQLLYLETINGSRGVKDIIVTEDEQIDCKVLTIGLQGDISMEEYLLLMYPNCVFYGVDFNASSATIKRYKKLLKATIIQAKINYDNVVKENSNDALKAVSFSYLLQNYYPHNKIDFLLIDINGTEIDLLYDILENYKKYPPICQITVTMHHSENSRLTKLFLKSFIKTIKTGPFVIIKTDKNNYSTEIYQIFLFNINDRYCAEKYIFSQAYKNIFT